jgi:hypothetical protein
MTAADVLVALALVTLALTMWYARGLVGLALKVLPATFALAGAWTAYELYRLGGAMGWDSPGSPAILVVWFALAASVTIALAGAFAFALQLRGLLRKGPRRRPALATRHGRIATVVAIVAVVGALLGGYRYYRSNQPSHEAVVRHMTFSRDGASLYSLDRAGVLKKWYAQRGLEADSWTLPEQGAATDLLVSADGRMAATLVGDRLAVWRLPTARPAERAALIDGAVGAVAVDGTRFALLARAELSVRSWADPEAVAATAALPAPALTVAPYGDRGLVVGFSDSTLGFYEAGASAVARRELGFGAPLEAAPRAIRADRTGRFLAVSDGATALVVLDLQLKRRDVLKLLAPLSGFAISEQNQLLIAELVAVRSYDLESRAGEPLFNHGGVIGAVAASSASDTVAIADREYIWLRNDGRHYAAPEVWLTGAVRVSRLASAVLPAERARRR